MKSTYGIEVYDRMVHIESGVCVSFTIHLQGYSNEFRYILMMLQHIKLMKMICYIDVQCCSFPKKWQGIINRSFAGTHKRILLHYYYYYLNREMV